ncbi:MAG TPA: imidazolonepropionase [Planctomycetes bacterium]|nr:imidazolonepropionase [Planctomycetaceae bacterium]HIN94797.1 imidazolonepropionase [Planctomycetota bacterium]
MNQIPNHLIRYLAPTVAALLLLGSASRVQANPEVPGAAQKQPVALVGATIHPVSGPVLENGTLLFEKGRIVRIGKGIPIPAGSQVINVKGKHIYPALFDSMTNTGLVEVKAVRASVDEAETGTINPNVKAHVAVNPDSELIPVTRSNGILLTLTAPKGGTISGQAAVIQLDGWTWEDMTLQAGAGMIVRWPNMAAVSDWWVEKSAKQQIEDRDKALKNLRKTFDDAEAYRRAREANLEGQDHDARWEALIPVLTGKLPVIIQANEIQQIQAAVAFASERKLKMILFGGYDAPRCAMLLKKHQVPVIVGGVYRLPQRRHDAYDDAYTLPERLRQAGIKFCISSYGRFGAANVRNLPYHAAIAAGFGLPEDEAIRAITLSPAEILGVSQRVGSLQVGKDATLIITTGSPLETTTQVEGAFIQGKRVQLNDRHKRLWRKYQQKYEQQKDAAAP